MYQLFKGFVPTSNKKCTMPFKGKSSEELLNWRDASQHDEFAGILNDNTILIDIDDQEQSEIMMKIVEDKQLACRIYATTRGKHFLFKNDGRYDKCWTHQILACGLQSDGKLGSKSSYSVLKYKGKERSIIYDKFDDEEYTTVPKWMLPVKAKTDFLGMTEGDGRNQELFNYILKLQSSGFSKDEAKECITIINQYVLKKPLDKRELDTILRDGAFQKPVFFDGRTFLHDKFGQFLISEYNIIKIGGVLHYFKNGVYVPANIDGIMIKHLPQLKKQQRTEVLSFMMAYIDKNTEVSSANYIAFANGIYDVSEGKLEPFTNDKVMTNKINWNYNPDAYSELVDQVLNNLACDDEQVRMLLFSLIDTLCHLICQKPSVLFWQCQHSIFCQAV